MASSMKSTKIMVMRILKMTPGLGIINARSLKRAFQISAIINVRFGLS